ncbi:MAG: hypothetical protein IK088_00610 [Lachnospiraceae bacterium]|nr:hypothetical protein [Lachnospiraceae bacterium]
MSKSACRTRLSGRGSMHLIGASGAFFIAFQPILWKSVFWLTGNKPDLPLLCFWLSTFKPDLSFLLFRLTDLIAKNALPVILA